MYRYGSKKTKPTKKQLKTNKTEAEAIPKNKAWWLM
jgi:hypothetical protein